MDIYERLKQLQIQLPKAPEPAGSYVTARTTGNLLYTSGQDCRNEDNTFPYLGKVGKDISVDEANEAAKLTALNCLAVIERELGDLNRITKFIKLLCFVNSNDTFVEQPIVMNGASDLLVEIFGEKGKHARTAVSAPSLPFNIPLEIEMIVEFT